MFYNHLVPASLRVSGLFNNGHYPMEPVAFNHHPDPAFYRPEKGYSFGFKILNVHKLLMDHKTNRAQTPIQHFLMPLSIN